MKAPPLRSFRVENFKAIADSGRIQFGWLTVLIGNNGVGKSSLIEALESFRDIIIDGLDLGMRRWRGFEQVWNKGRERKPMVRSDHRTGLSHPMRFRVDWKRDGRRFAFQQAITVDPGDDSLFIQREQMIHSRPSRVERWSRGDRGNVYFQGTRPPAPGVDAGKLPKLNDGESLLKQFAWETLEQWQFLMLNPDRMGVPLPQERASSEIRLAKDGSNIAEYLDEIKKIDKGAFDGLLDAIRVVLPYAADLQPILKTELGREVYLRLREASFDVPGWLLSTGTLRVVALLACLRHPKPPPLLVIEEIENGLDPRTLNLVVEEIRAAVAEGTTQVILTTHSPYLLDLFDLSHLLIVERKGGEPVFQRPNPKQLATWSRSFAPGKLYTMGRLTGGSR